MNEKKYLTLINEQDNNAALDVFCWVLSRLGRRRVHCWVVKARTDLWG